MARLGHRVRWTAAWVLLAVWFVALVLNVGSGVGNLLLVLGLGLVVYELLAVDRPG